MLLFEFGIIHAPATHHARREVLEQDVALHDEIEKDLAPFGLGQIEHERLFAPVDEVVRAGAVPVVVALVVVRHHAGEGAAPRHVGTRGPFDLDHFGPHIAEKAGRIRTGEHVTAVDDAYALQGQLAHA
jgi:hypothetical protein